MHLVVVRKVDPNPQHGPRLEEVVEVVRLAKEQNLILIVVVMKVEHELCHKNIYRNNHESRHGRNFIVSYCI